MKTLALVAVLAFAPLTAHAQYYPGTPNAPPDQTQPAQNNTYRTQSRDNGSTTTYGSNERTGSTWQTTQQPNGNQSGVNAAGQPWTYNAGQQTYSNPQAGQRCVYSTAGQQC